MSDRDWAESAMMQLVKDFPNITQMYGRDFFIAEGTLIVRQCAIDGPGQELASLRQERDALKKRVEELERKNIELNRLVGGA